MRPTGGTIEASTAQDGGPRFVASVEGGRVAAGLMDMGLKTFVAYRMQFFLYIKSCGVADIGPANCWAGVDMPNQDG